MINRKESQKNDFFLDYSYNMNMNMNMDMDMDMNMNVNVNVNVNVNKINRWGYDSYSYDEIWDYIEENDPEQIENDIWGYFSDAQSWNDIDFVLGIAIYRIRTGVVLKDKTLRKLREIIDNILERSPFEEWEDKNKRIIKLQHERRIINALLKKMDFKFGEIIPRLK